MRVATDRRFTALASNSNIEAKLQGALTVKNTYFVE